MLPIKNKILTYEKSKKNSHYFYFANWISKG